MSSLRLELAKLHRKHVPLIVMLLVAAILAWAFMGARQEGRGSNTGWASLFFSAPLMNSIFLSLLAAVVTSRVADIDHEADAYKQLLCLQSTRSLLVAKLACVTLIMALAVALELCGLAAIGLYMEFPTSPAASSWCWLFGSQLVACLTVVAIVGAIALRWENQFVSVASGLALSLAGLFSSFLPQALQRLVPSGYFTLLATLRINWSAASSDPLYYQMPTPWADYALALTVIVGASALAYAIFARKEL